MSYVPIPDDPEGPPKEEFGKAPNTEPAPKQQTWADLGLEARAMILLTFGILLVAGLTAYVFLQQARLMEGQLEEMRSGGGQTERLIILSQGQLTQASHQVQELGRQVGQLTRGADETAKVADAAHIANQNAVLAERPWMGAVNLTAVPPILEGHASKITLTTVNAGKRPARILKFATSSKPYYQLPANPEYFVTEGSSKEPSHSIVVPGLPLASEWMSIPLTPSEVQNIKSGAENFYVYAVLTYEDVGASKMTKPYTTNICWFFIPKLNEFGYCPAYNDAK
jgi:hypothetical protein